MRPVSLAFAAAFVSIASPAWAQGAAPDKKVCIAAAERGQELRDAKKMRDARSQFLLCARKECPPAVAGECNRWAAEAEAALGSVKLSGVDASGKKITDAKVVIDGAPWSDEIPTTSVLLDPGSHEIRFERSGSEPVVRTISLSMGERDRAVEATFKTTESASPATPAMTTPAKDTSKPSEPAKEGGGSLVAPLVLGGIGVAAIGAAGAFWLMGNSDLDAARDRCQTTGCTDSDADSAKTKHLIGDIALGVGIVAIVASAYFLVTREKAPSPVIRF